MIAKDSSVKNMYSVEQATFANDSIYSNKLKDCQEKFNWKEVKDEEREVIKNTFNTKVNEQVTDERVAKEMIRLFNSTKWEEVGGIE